jgi:hypothetical protein
MARPEFNNAIWGGGKQEERIPFGAYLCPKFQAKWEKKPTYQIRTIQKEAPNINLLADLIYESVCNNDRWGKSWGKYYIPPVVEDEDDEEDEEDEGSPKRKKKKTSWSMQTYGKPHKNKRGETIVKNGRVITDIWLKKQDIIKMLLGDPNKDSAITSYSGLATWESFIDPESHRNLYYQLPVGWDEKKMQIFIKPILLKNLKIDVDCDSFTLEDYIQTQLKIKALFELLNINYYVMNSGGKGFHLIIPFPTPIELPVASCLAQIIKPLVQSLNSKMDVDKDNTQKTLMRMIFSIHKTENKLALLADINKMELYSPIDQCLTFYKLTKPDNQLFMDYFTSIQQWNLEQENLPYHLFSKHQLPEIIKFLDNDLPLIDTFKKIDKPKATSKTSKKRLAPPSIFELEVETPTEKIRDESPAKEIIVIHKPTKKEADYLKDYEPGEFYKELSQRVTAAFRIYGKVEGLKFLIDQALRIEGTDSDKQNRVERYEYYAETFNDKYLTKMKRNFEPLIQKILTEAKLEIQARQLNDLHVILTHLFSFMDNNFKAQVTIQILTDRLSQATGSTKNTLRVQKLIDLLIKVFPVFTLEEKPRGKDVKTYKLNWKPQRIYVLKDEWIQVFCTLKES